MAIALMAFETNLLLIPCLILLPLLFLILKPKSNKVPNLPPGPKQWPVVGNILSMGNKPHVALAQLAKVHGPLISLRQGTQLTIVASSSVAAAEILKNHDRELSGRHIPDVLLFAKNPELNRLAWTLDLSEQWKSFRALMRANLFAPKIVENQSVVREKKASEMLEFLGSKEGDVVRIRDAIFVYVFNSLGNYYFSRDFVPFGGEESQRVSMLVKEMMLLLSSSNISDKYPMLRFLDLQGLRKKNNEYVRRMRSVWDSYIIERRASKFGAPGNNADFLDVLIQSGFSDEQISYIFLEIFGAVSDSSASTIEWAMAELMKNPEEMSKVRKELEEEIPGRSVRESYLANLAYLHACVKETLRLHPPAPLLIPHRAIESCQVMGYMIPKDAHVIVNAWAIARDPAIWEDPLSFKPERFILNSDLDYKGNNFDYLPFGRGRRICAGIPMAIRQVQLALASLILSFDWSLPNNMLPHEIDMNESFSLTMLMEKPLELIAKQRK